jgi:hypothetical protein
VFGFAVALVASNVFAVVHAITTRAEQTHADAKVAHMPLSDFAIVEGLRTVYRGMTIVLDDEHWRPFQTTPTAQFAKLLLGWAQHI